MSIIECFFSVCFEVILVGDTNSSRYYSTVATDEKGGGQRLYAAIRLSNIAFIEEHGVIDAEFGRRINDVLLFLKELSSIP